MDFEKEWFEQDRAFKETTSEKLDTLSTQVKQVEANEKKCQENHLAHLKADIEKLGKQQKVLIGIMAGVLLAADKFDDLWNLIQTFL